MIDSPIGSTPTNETIRERMHDVDANDRIAQHVHRIAELEREHASLGVSFKTTGDGKSLQTDERVLKHVVHVLEAVKELDDDPSQIESVDD